tara:strand:- start:282 stop:950 length:669 start_codon:yes stop_codon:yes gene_type:complete
MKEDIQLRIVELMDDGATCENSLELKALVESSDEASKFYESILVSESMLESFFGGERAQEIESKIDALVEEQLSEPQTILSFNFKPVVGFAIAASLAIIALTFIDIPSNESVSSSSDSEENVYIATEYAPELIVVEESEPLVISGTEMDTLWSTATEIADDLGVDRYEIMYVVYEGNKESFVDNNIHQPRQDADFYVDLSIIENLETQFIIEEVKRHIYCHC